MYIYLPGGGANFSMHFDHKPLNAEKLICPECNAELHICSCRTRTSSIELREASPAAVTSTVQKADTNIGRIIGDRYQLEAVLGKGGMGTVYRARHTKLGKPLALKMLKVHESNLDDLRVRFEREALAASTLKHPQLTCVHDYGVTEEAEPYLVMDYVEGTTLSSVIKTGGALPPARAIEVFSQICAGMSYAHAQGILHRDLKPSNIMLGKDHLGKDMATVVDFGIAKMLWGGDSGKHTSTGELLGSPTYMSPEQCQGQQLDVRSDIYSFGCLMYETLTGVPPFSAEHPVQLLYMHMNETTQISRNLLIPPGLEAIVMKCLEKDRSKRFQSVDELAQALKNPAELPTSAVDSNKFRVNRPVLIMAAISIVIAMAVGFSIINSDLKNAKGSMQSASRVGGAPKGGAPTAATHVVNNSFATVVQANDVAGVWQSDWGPVAININDGHVTGAWKQETGKVGTITDGTFDEKSGCLEFHYFEPWNQRKGSAKLFVSNAGHQLSGTWQQPGGSGTWTLSR